MDCYYIFQASWVVILYFFGCLTYLVVRKVKDPPPATDLSVFHIVYSSEERLTERIKEETDENIIKILKLELENYARIKRELEKITSNS
jgi:hypothetical protein